MYRNGFDGTLHRGKRGKVGPFRDISLARAVVKRHMEASLGCASLDSEEFAQTFSHFNCSHLHTPTDPGVNVHSCGIDSASLLRLCTL